jgi:hypothetical protein
MCRRGRRSETMAETWRSLCYVAAGVVALYGVGYVAVSAPTPAVWSPYPAASFLLISAGVPRALSVLVVPALFALSAAPLVARPYRGRLRYAAVLTACAVTGNALYIATRAADGGVHHGWSYVILITAMNAVMIFGLWIAWSVCRDRPTSAKAVLFILALFGWLAYGAFPYFGDAI